MLHGGDDIDILSGGPGADTFIGRNGADIMDGGEGTETAIFLGRIEYCTAKAKKKLF